MKLITETSFDISCNEDTDCKDLYIEGIFSTANVKNINGRIYTKSILEREINRLMEKISKKCCFGELTHPPNAEINLDKVAILIEELEWIDDNVYGKAKVLDTPMGNIAKTLIREGNLGISSRGLGSVNEDNTVNEDFMLLTYDLVADPSNKPSWVKGIYEGAEFTIPDTSVIKEVEESKIDDNKNMDLNEQKVKYFDFINKILDTII